MEGHIQQTRVGKRLERTDGTECGPGDDPNLCACGSRIQRYVSDYTGERKVMCLASHVGWNTAPT